MDRHTEDIVVRIAHFSVKEYLNSDRIHRDAEASPFGIRVDQAHAQIASACLMVLLEPSFVTRADNHQLLNYALGFWVHHYREGKKTEAVKSQVWHLMQNTENSYDNWILLCEKEGYWGPLGSFEHSRRRYPFQLDRYIGLSPTTFQKFLDETRPDSHTRRSHTSLLRCGKKRRPEDCSNPPC